MASDSAQQEIDTATTDGDYTQNPKKETTKTKCQPNHLNNHSFQWEKRQIIWNPTTTGPDQQDNHPTSQQPCCIVLESLVLHRGQKQELVQFS